MNEKRWFTEGLHGDCRQQLRIDRQIYRGKTSFQSVEIYETASLGRFLCLDGVVQTTESDEAHYHELLVHPMLFTHGDVRNVLIIGGADGGALREILRHPVDRVLLVDIDEELIEVCRAHLPSLSRGAFDDPRAILAPGDGASFVAQTEDQFDAIFVDSTDPLGPGAVLFTEPFFSDCRRALRSGGVLTTQSGVPFFQGHELAESHRRRHKVFTHAGAYAAPVPFYVGGHMAFGWASDVLDVAAVPLDRVAARIAESGLHFRAYDAGVHAGVFALPPWIAELLGSGASGRD